MKSFSKRIIQTLKRPIVLTALVLLPLGWSAVDAFAKDHAFLINASPSLPNWAFWLDKHARIDGAAQWLKPLLCQPSNKLHKFSDIIIFYHAPHRPGRRRGV